jgi:hypothetical protein
MGSATVPVAAFGAPPETNSSPWPPPSLFQEKKDCLFFGAGGLACGCRRRINPNQPSKFKYKPNTGQYRPKNESTITFIEPWSLFPLAVCHASVQL